MKMKPTIKSFIEQNKEDFLNNFLIPWLKIPSISSDAARHQDMLKASEFLQKELQNSGLYARQIALEKGNPVVYAEKIIDPNLPTVLIYGHYDVQPIKLPELWKIGDRKLDPFNPVKIGDRLYARGATDDKGQLAAHTLAMRYFKQTSFPCNIKFVVEGDEEGGGDSTFFDFIKKSKDLLTCDAVLISDSGTLEEGYPTIITNMKGILIAEVKSKKPEDLVSLIHKSHNPIRNKILLKGFYDDVMETAIDQKILEKFGKPSESMGRIIKPEDGYSQLHHRWHRPTNSPLFLSYANLNPIAKERQKTIKIIAKGPKEALHSGSFGGPVQEPALHISHLLTRFKENGVKYEIDYIDYGSRTLSTSIQPTGEAQITIEDTKKVLKKYYLEGNLFTIETIADRKKYLNKEFNNRFGDGNPTAYLSFRLVSNQNPKKIYESLVELVKETGQGIKIKNLGLGEPFITDTKNSYCKAVTEGLKKGYGTKSVHFMAEGGSIPINCDTFQAPVIFAGFSSPTDNLHAPNESILIEKGILAGARSIVYSLQEIGKLTKE